MHTKFIAHVVECARLNVKPLSYFQWMTLVNKLGE